MASVSVSVEINAPAQKVFDVVTDLQSYPNWLPNSDLFKGTTEISDSPIKAGTTYNESGRPGRVLELERPSRVVFHQPLNLDPTKEDHVLDITVEVTLEENAEGVTTMVRNAYFGYPEPLLSLQTSFEESGTGESARVADLLKKYVESLP